MLPLPALQVPATERIGGLVDSRAVTEGARRTGVRVEDLPSAREGEKGAVGEGVGSSRSIGSVDVSKAVEKDIEVDAGDGGDVVVAVVDGNASVEGGGEGELVGGTDANSTGVIPSDTEAIA